MRFNSRLPLPFLLLNLHGLGEREDRTTQGMTFPDATSKQNVALDRMLWRICPPQMLKDGINFLPESAIVISPNLNNYGDWVTGMSAPFIDYVFNHYKVDRSRVYITGISLGGGGTWMYAKAYPTIPAAIVPISGTQGSGGYAVLKGMPLWAYHNETDWLVPYSNTTSKMQVITGINPDTTRPKDGKTYTASFNGTAWTWRLGMDLPPLSDNPHLTTLPGSNHDDSGSWGPAYANPAVWTWMFQQKK